MTSILIDSNVLIDLFEPSSDWREWSSSCLEEFGQEGPLVINPLIYAEVSVSFLSKELLENALPSGVYTREALPWEAGFEAGKAYRDYRRRGGDRRSPLPDFYIGAHAAVMNYRLLTRDARRYRAYFPGVEIIAPDTHP